MTSLVRPGIAMLSGLLFGFGLSLSGMLNPAKVIGFLDIAGAWDPALAFVLAGAVSVSGISYALSRRMRHPLLSDSFQLPSKLRVDRRLIIGSALFGVGWGLVGFCPGPALAALPLGLTPVFTFCAAMMAGIAIHDTVAADRPRPGMDRPS